MIQDEVKNKAAYLICELGVDGALEKSWNDYNNAKTREDKINASDLISVLKLIKHDDYEQ